MTQADVVVEHEWSDVALPGLGRDRVYLLTGGSGAIGTRIAEALLAAGANVAVTGRSPERVAEVIEDLGRDRCLGLPGDVSRFDACLETVAAVERRWGRLDGLVHLAAVGDEGMLTSHADPGLVDRVLATNVRGTVGAVQACAPLLERSGGGSIVALASVAAHRAYDRGGGVYGASKAAVIRYVRQAAIELGPSGIRANSVSAGQTPTVLRRAGEAPGAPPVGANLHRGSSGERVPLRRRGQMDDYVGPILFLLSDLASYVTAQDLLVDGGITFRG